jgi:putative heme iron utilization protein
LAESIEGFPFGSLVPFALTNLLEPIAFLSGLAQHFKNLAADSRTSLLIQEPERNQEPQTRWRITLVGTFHQVDPTEIQISDLQKRYLTRVPGANRTMTLPDFRFWVMKTQRIRFIAGFGKIRWLDPQYIRESHVS